MYAMIPMNVMNGHQNNLKLRLLVLLVPLFLLGCAGGNTVAQSAPRVSTSAPQSSVASPMPSNTVGSSGYPNLDPFKDPEVLQRIRAAYKNMNMAGEQANQINTETNQKIGEENGKLATVFGMVGQGLGMLGGVLGSQGQSSGTNSPESKDSNAGVKPGGTQAPAGNTTTTIPQKTDGQTAPTSPINNGTTSTSAPESPNSSPKPQQVAVVPTATNTEETQREKTPNL